MTNHDILCELARVKTLFQLRALKAAMGINSGREVAGTPGEAPPITSSGVFPATHYSITFVGQKKQEGL